MSPGALPRAALAMLSLLAALVAAREARAQVNLEVLPTFGEACVPRSGPTELVVGVTNTGSATLSGTVRLDNGTAQFLPGVRTVFAVPFTAAAHARVTVRIPTTPAGIAPGDTSVSVQDIAGRTLAQRPLLYTAPVDSILLDATPQARLAFALRAVTTPDPNNPSFAPSPAASALAGVTPCQALRVTQTGEVVLPRTLAGYNAVAAVVADAGTVMSLPAAERDALADYVLAGGTLVLIPSRPEELHHPTLQAFVGAGVTGGPPTALDGTGGQWLTQPPGAAPGTFPLPATLQSPVTFRGGNLHTRTLSALFTWGSADLLGATAEYGFGHVHVLSFNPALPPALEDPWTLTFMAQLTQVAAGARGTRLIADGPEVAQVPPAVRRALDPAEGFRPALGVAVALLIAYAAAAGPVAFRLARRRGRPVLALAALPALSTLAFAGVVAVGSVSRGVQGRAVRLALVELPAGMSRGALRRYHGYFSGHTGAMEVRAAGHDRRLYADPDSGSGYVTLWFERDRESLRGLAVTSWSTAVVREEARETLPGGGVTLQPDAAGRIRVVNRTSLPMRDVLLVAPGGAEAWSFPSLAPGEAKLATQGTPAPATLLVGLSTGNWLPFATGAQPTGDLSGWRPGWAISALFGGGEERGRLWDAVLSAAPGVGSAGGSEPVLLGVLAGPARGETDGGLAVARDDVVVRVVGWGGAP